MKTLLFFAFCICSTSWAQAPKKADDYIFFKNLKNLPKEENLRKANHNGIATFVLFGAMAANQVGIIDNPAADSNLRRATTALQVGAGIVALFTYYHTMRHQSLYLKKTRLGLSSNGIGIRYQLY